MPDLRSISDLTNAGAASLSDRSQIRPAANGGIVEPILFFDGVCGMCNRFVDFVLSRDQGAIFRFAPLQGQTAADQLTESDARDLNTAIVLDRGVVYRKSSAIIRVLWTLGGLWSFVAASMWIVPKPLRDAAYSIVARHRYRVFGKKELCRMPSPAEQSRFLP